jgi:HAMP domain-containing protein
VRPPRLLRTASFRLAAAYTLLFAVSVAALGAFVLLTTRSALEQQMTGRLETEMGDLESEFRSAGIDRLTATVRERAHGARALDYLVQDPAGRRIAGDLPPIGGRTGWIDVTSDDHGSGEAGDRERLRVLAKRLPDGTLLAVGEDAGHVEEATDAISSALWAALGLTVLLGIAGGLVLSAGFLRRIDQIVRTADAIVDGHLEQRIPESGTRDDLDHLAQTLNRMLDRIAELMAGMRQIEAGTRARDFDRSTWETSPRPSSRLSRRPSRNRAGPWSHRSAKASASAATRSCSRSCSRTWSRTRADIRRRGRGSS